MALGFAPLSDGPISDLPAAPATGPVANASQVEQPDLPSAAATAALAANASTQEANDASSGAATVALVANAAAQEAQDTSAAAAGAVVTANAASGEPSDTSASAAAVTVGASASSIEASDTSASAATAAIQATASTLEAPDASAGAAVVALQAAGSTLEARDSSAGAATASVQASASTLEVPDTSAAAATAAIAASGAITEPSDLSAADGTVAALGLGAYASILEDSDASAASGTAALVATAALTESPDAAATAGTTALVGAGATLEAPDSAVGTAGLNAQASGAVVEDSDVDAAVASHVIFASVGHFATLNPADNNGTLSNGNLTWVGAATAAARSTVGVSSGKWYWEVSCPAFSGTAPLPIVGIADAAATLWAPGNDADGWGFVGSTTTPTTYHNSTNTSYGAAWTSTSDVIGIALDMDAGTLEFYRNGVGMGIAFTGLTGTMYACVGGQSSIRNSTVDCNFGPSLAYGPPAGFNPGLYDVAPMMEQPDGGAASLAAVVGVQGTGTEGDLDAGFMTATVGASAAVVEDATLEAGAIIHLAAIDAATLEAPDQSAAAGAAAINVQALLREIFDGTSAAATAAIQASAALTEDTDTSRARAKMFLLSDQHSAWLEALARAHGLIAPLTNNVSAFDRSQTPAVPLAGTRSDGRLVQSFTNDGATAVLTPVAVPTGDPGPSALSPQEALWLERLVRIHGLIDPLTTTAAARGDGTVNQALTDDGTTVTATLV